MNNIIDPITHLKYPITDTKGKQILKSYVHYFQNGGNGGGGGGGLSSSDSGGGGGGGKGLSEETEESEKVVQGETWLNLASQINIYIPKFKMNILLIGEGHIHAGDKLMSGHRVITQQEIQKYVKKFYSPEAVSDRWKKIIENVIN